MDNSDLPEKRPLKWRW